MGCRAVSRVSRLWFYRIRGENTPVVRVVINQSGLMRLEEGRAWARTGLGVVMGVGCAIAVGMESGGER